MSITKSGTGTIYKDKFVEIGLGGFEFDEMWAKDAFVHIERMSDTSWWMGIELPDGSRWMLNFGAVNERASFFFRVDKDCLGDPRPFVAGSALASEVPLNIENGKRALRKKTLGLGLEKKK